jgi:1-acyl-sn-glycerol-3-phosphate acyltransferase
MALHNILNLSKSIITYILWISIVPPLFIPCIVIALLPKKIRHDSRIYFFWSTIISHTILKLAFIRVSVTGKANLPQYPQQPAIFIINHASALDIPLVEIVAGSYPHVWMSKAEYKKIPFFGFLLKRMHILVDKNSLTSARNALVLMHQQLQNNARHALIFPEGTRHTDGNVHRFYSGFAILAQKLKRPIVPIVISRNHSIFPKKSLIIDSSVSPVKINIGKPVYVTEQTNLDEFVTCMQKYFEQQLTTMAR